MYRIDIKKKEDRVLPEINFYKKDDIPEDALNVAAFLGAGGGYGLGHMLTLKPFEDATNKALMGKANSLYESAGRRVPGIIEDLSNGNRALAGLDPEQKAKVTRKLTTPFLERLIQKAKDFKSSSSTLSYIDALRKMGQSAGEAALARGIEKGIKGFSTPWGRMGKRISLGISSALLARLIVKKYYE